MGARAARQMLLVSIALALYAALGHASALALLGAYAATLLVWQLPALREVERALRPATLLALAALLAAPGLAFVWRTRSEWLDAERLHGLATHVRDRLRLVAQPVIAPPLVTSDRPQTFFVQADDAKQVEVRIGAHARTAEALGHGLFRLEYDPRRDGLPRAKAERVQAELRIDGRSVWRELHAVEPLAHPRWFARSPSGALAATVSEETDELFVVDARGLRDRAAGAGDGPSDCAFLDDTRVLVAYRHTRKLALYELTRSQWTAEVELGGEPARMAASADRSRFAVALAGPAPAVVLIEASGPALGGQAALRVSARIALQAQPDWLAFGVDASELIVSTRRPAQLVRFVDGSQGVAVTHTLALQRPVITLARARDGRSVHVAVTDLQTQGAEHLGNHFIHDQLLRISTSDLRIEAQTLTARRSPRQSKPGDVDRGLSPLGLFAADDGALFATFAGSEELWRMHASAPEPSVVDLGEHALYAPHGVVQLGDAVVVSSPAAGALAWVRQGRVEHVEPLAPRDDALLAHDRAALARRVGERGFYEATRSGIACQSCHLHADSDDAAHNLGDHRLIPTLSVRGLLATAPYLRDGSYPLLADLDEVSRTIFRGHLRSQGARGETLQAFLEALPRRSPHRVRDISAERRGLDAFVSAGCPECHAPPAFTHLGMYPMAQLFPTAAAQLATSEMLDVPSLLSVATAPPYLHDGRARTLADVLGEHNPDNLHGDTRALSPAQRTDLVRFLESL